MLPQEPPEHEVPAGQTLPQAPQFELLVPRVVSHPLDALPSQLPKPGSQDPSPQAPPAQTGVPWTSDGQAMPQAPQLARLVPRLVSQPLTALPSQLPKPAAQAPRPHTPPTHVALALAGRGHALPHTPQLSTVTARLVSQPFVGSLSQSP